MLQKRHIIFFILLLKMPDFVMAQQNNYNKDSLINAVLQSINADSVRQTIQTLQDFNTRFALAPDHKNPAVFISNKLKALGYNDVKLDSFMLDSIQWPQGSGTFYNTWQYTVVAQSNGTIDASKIFILGAHYDDILNQGDAFTYAPGADDNASGIAAMIETARVFKLHNIQPAYTIRFVAFAAEELYLNGSYKYTDKVFAANDNIVLMINNDMVAHNLQPANNWKFNIQKYPQTDWIENLTNQIAQDYTQLTPVVATNSIEHSDSYPFYLRGYPAVFFQEYDFCFLLHTISDSINSLDMNYCAEVTKISCGILLNTNLTSTGTANIQKAEINTDIYPNPVQDNMNVSINSKLNQKVTISVFDMNNHQVFENERLLTQSGINNFVYDLRSLSKGIYYCTIKTPQSVNCQKIIKL